MIEGKYRALVDTIMDETNCGLESGNGILEAFAQELAGGVTAERDAEIAAMLPVPYTKKVNARAQIDGDMLLIPRAVIATASKVPGEDWKTSTKGPRMGRNKTGCAVGVHVELSIPDVVEIVKVVILWRREK